MLRFLTVVAFMLMILSAASAYDGIGAGEEDEMPTVECNDGIDNDGDDLVDENDPGCTQPYYADDSEGLIYDTDMSWVFSQGDTDRMRDTGPSIFVEGEVVAGEEVYEDEQISSDSVREYYVEDPTERWGHGELASVEASVDGGRSDEDGKLIDYPHGTQCGGGLSSCPADIGFTGEYEIGMETSSSLMFVGQDSELWNRYGGTSKNCQDCEVEIRDNPDIFPNDDYGTIETGELSFDGADTDIGHVYSLDATSSLEQVHSIDGYDRTGSTTYYTNGDTSGTCDPGENETTCDVGGGSTGSCTLQDEVTTAYEAEDIREDVSLVQSSPSASYSEDYEWYANTGSASDTAIYEDSYEDAQSGSWHTDYDCDEVTVGEGDYTIDDVESDGSIVTDEDRESNTKYYYQDQATIELDVIEDVNVGRTSDIEHDAEWPVYDASSSLGYYVGGGRSDTYVGNNPSLSRTKFEAKAGGGATDIYMEFNFRNSWKPTGAEGEVGGLVAIEEGEGIVGHTEGFMEGELSMGSESNYISVSDVPVPDCPDNYTKCVGAVTPYATHGGPGTFRDINFYYVTGNPIETSASLGTCERYKMMSGDEDIQCFHEDESGGPGTPVPGPGACGDIEGEYWHDMEGPAIDDDTMDEYPRHQQACLDDPDACVLHGDQVSEGTVAQVNPQFSTAEYQDPEASPDWSVCLSVSSEEGGEWYSLDNVEAEEYILNERYNEFVEDEDETDPSRIAFYWRENPNPHHEDYNPTGGEEGLALETNCDDDLSGCEHTVNENGFFHTFGLETVNGNLVSLQDIYRDKDFNPQGENDEGDSHVTSALYEGYVDRLYDMTDQLEPGMGTVSFGMSDEDDENTVDRWDDSIGSQDRANRWAITSDPEKCVTSRGNAVEPGHTEFREDVSDSERGGLSSSSVSKTSKAMGNSICVVAETDNLETHQGEPIPEGRGVWIDPDDMREMAEAGDIGFGSQYNNWQDVLDENGFQIDLTGPDSGLGLKDDSMGEGEYRWFDSSRVVKGDIYFQGEIDNDVDQYLEPPMCGDDSDEFLLEELGEIQNSRQTDGHYACANTQDMCVDMNQNPRLMEIGAYSQTNTLTEDIGRPKNSKALCGQAGEPHPHFEKANDLSRWYNQDFGYLYNDGSNDGRGVQTCRENSLHGDLAVRWMDDNYIQEHPYAVQGGIDDSWNPHFDQLYSQGDYTQRLEYVNDTKLQEREGVTWREVEPGSEIFENYTPVPTPPEPPEDGEIVEERRPSATLGFCAGDDDGEYFITQQSNTDYVDTDRNIVGVANNPGDCVLDNEQISYPSLDDDRRLYNTGDEVVLAPGEDADPIATIACFQGVWYQEWPVVFQEDSVEVGLGESATATYHVINVESTERTFEITKFGDVDQFTDFTNVDDDSFEVTLEPQSSQQFQLEIYGGEDGLSGDQWVQANAVNSPIDGEDSLDVSINDQTDTTGQDTRGVNGIGFIQLAVLLLASLAMFYTQS